MKICDKTMNRSCNIFAGGKNLYEFLAFLKEHTVTYRRKMRTGVQASKCENYGQNFARASK
jgi:hypothetical protein